MCVCVCVCVCVYIYIIITVYYILTTTLGGFKYTFCDTVCKLFVFLYDNLMMVAEGTETCW